MMQSMTFCRVTDDFSTIQSTGNLRHAIFRWLLTNHVKVANKNVVDLGAGHCAFARIARKFGAEVTAVDGRENRVPEDIESLGIRFVRSDVREFNLNSFDVVLIFGLLYHLGINDQISLLSRCQGKIVLIDTQVYWPDIVFPVPLFEWQLSLIEAGGYEGIVYPEKTNVMASIGNRTSFWHTEASYEKLFSNCGFTELTAYRPLYPSKHGFRSFYRLV